MHNQTNSRRLCDDGVQGGPRDSDRRERGALEGDRGSLSEEPVGGVVPGKVHFLEVQRPASLVSRKEAAARRRAARATVRGLSCSVGARQAREGAGAGQRPMF